MNNGMDHFCPRSPARVEGINNFLEFSAWIPYFSAILLEGEYRSRDRTAEEIGFSVVCCLLENA
jgi:hypothetical protein